MTRETPMLTLIGIFTIAWLLVLGGTVIIFHLIVPFSYWGGFADSIAKGIFTTVLGLVWLYALSLLRNLIVKLSLPERRKKRQPAS